MSLFVNERYSNSNHVTDDTRAQTNRGIIGGNCVFDIGSKLALTVTPTTGAVAVADGAFSICGHTGGVVLSESANYTPPPSDTAFIRNIVVIRYSRDTSTNIETYKLAVVSSEVQASESAAEALSVSLASDTIDESTTVAEFPLWSFVATATTNTTPVQLFSLCPSLAELNEALGKTDTQLKDEIAERQTETEALSNAVNALSKGIVTIASGLTGSNYAGTARRAAYVAFILKFSNGEVMTIPSIAGTYTKYFYSVEAAGTLSSASKVTVGIRNLTLTTSDTITLNYGSTTNADVCGYVTTIYGIR